MRDEQITFPFCLLMSVCGSEWARMTNGHDRGAQLNPIIRAPERDPSGPENRVNRESCPYKPDITDIGANSLDMLN